MNLTIVTAVFGGYDVVAPLPRGVHGICFTDGEVTAAGWETRRLVSGLGPRRLNRFVKAKLLDLVDADATLYVDGQIEITEDPREWARAARAREFSAFSHPWRSCVYEEARICLKERRGDPAEIAAQIARYRDAQLPTSSGLFAGGVLLRQHTDRVREFCDEWWAETSRGSERDQISLGFVTWKRSFRIHTLPGSYRGPPFAFRGHRKRRK